MAATKQSQAISLLNDLLTFAQQVTALRDFANVVNNKYTKQGASTVWAALPTAALGTDGSLGLADGTPNVARPIDTRAVTSLARAVSSNDAASAALPTRPAALIRGAITKETVSRSTDPAFG